MATTKPSNLSERSNGTPHGRRTPRSSPGPRDRNIPEKLVASTHVKSPSSSSRSDTATKTIRSTPSPSSTMSAATKKPPSPSSQPQRSNTLKDRPLRAPSSLPKSASFSRTTQDKITSKTLRTTTSSRSLPSTKAKTPGIGPSTVMKAKVSKAAQEEIKSHDQPKSINSVNVVDEDVTVVARAPDHEENHEHVETPVIEDHHGLEELSVSSEPPPELHHEELALEDDLEISKEEKEHDQEDEQHHKELDKIKEDEQMKKAGDDQGGTEEKHGEVDGEQKSESVDQVKKPAEMPDRRKEVAPDGNAVIEKTASRLASRKNRVLALVGAFETVISLQEPEGAQQGHHAAAKEEEDNNTTLQSSQSV